MFFLLGLQSLIVSPTKGVGTGSSNYHVSTAVIDPKICGLKESRIKKSKFKVWDASNLFNTNEKDVES